MLRMRVKGHVRVSGDCYGADDTDLEMLGMCPLETDKLTAPKAREELGRLMKARGELNKMCVFVHRFSVLSGCVCPPLTLSVSE